MYSSNEKRYVEQFNKWSETYDQGFWSYYFRVCYRNICKKIIKYKGKKILDIGCGTGGLFEELEKSTNITKYTGVDFSELMINKAKQKYNKSGKAVFIYSSATNIDIKDESTDIVVCANAFHHIEKPNKALSEAFRILKKGGYVIILDPCKGGLLRTIWTALLVKIFNEKDVAYYDKQELLDFFQQANFKVIQQKNFLYFTLMSIGQK